MDYSEFDSLPLNAGRVTIVDSPLHDGIRDLPTLGKVAEIVSARMGEIGRDADEVAGRSGVNGMTVRNMLGGTPVPLEDAMHVFDTLGVKPLRVPCEYLECR